MSLARGTDLESAKPSEPEGEGPRNGRTRIAVLDGAFGKEAPSPREAFAATFELAAAAASCVSPEAVVVAVVDRYRSVAGLVCLEPGQAITIGRHSECPIRLREVDVSLRHLAIHHGRDGGGAVLRAWDLATGRPFRTEDGETAEAVTAEGLLFATLGRYAIAALPCDAIDWDAGLDGAWEALPRRTVSGRLATGTAVREPFAPAHTSRVTRTGSAIPLTGRGDPHTAIADLIVDGPGGQRRYHISAEQLERGLLVGRYDRCASGGIEDGAVSRVHLLIAATASGIHAIDTASTNGTHGPGGAFLSRALGHEATLRLARQTHLHWRRRIAAHA